MEGFEPAERRELGVLLTSIWERIGDYGAWSQVAAAPDEKAA